MKVAILGTGLIGGSVGLALKASSTVEVVAYDLDSDAAKTAVARGAADRSADSARAAVDGSDLVFLCTPVRGIAGMAREAAGSLSPGAILTDVGSTKLQVVLEIEKSLPESAIFIGGHPMAGSEDAGIEAARADLFAAAWWILTPTDRSDPDAYARLHGVLTTLGARVMALSPAEHDELMATISHLPQLVATTLMNVAAEQGKDRAALLALAAGGFRDVTRIAASNPEIWLDICEQNGQAIGVAIHAFAARLEALGKAVTVGDASAMRHALTSASAARRGLLDKEVQGTVWDVRMPVPDRPGVLAEVTTAVGSLGINIEDLQIRHSAEGGRGFLHLSVVGEQQAEVTASALRALGYEAKATLP